MCRYIAKSRKTKYQVNYRRVRVGIPIRSLLHVLLRALYRQNPMIEITFFYGALYTEYVIDHSTSEGPSIACGQTTMHMLSIDMCMLCTQYQRGTGRRCRSISSSLASSLPTRRRHKSQSPMLSLTSQDQRTLSAACELAIPAMSITEHTSATCPCTSPERSLVGQPVVPWTTKHSRHGAQKYIVQISKQRSSVPARSLPGGVYDV